MVWLRLKNHAPQVWLNWDWNSWPSGHGQYISCPWDARFNHWAIMNLIPWDAHLNHWTIRTSFLETLALTTEPSLTSFLETLALTTEPSLTSFLETLALPTEPSLTFFPKTLTLTTEPSKTLMQLFTIPVLQVIGVPDERLGEQVCACVILNEGQEASEQDIKDFCKGKVITCN